MSRRRKPNSTRPNSVPDGFKLVKGPDSRLKFLFKILSEVIDAADRSLVEEQDDGPAARFDRAFFVRGINILKAVEMLTKAGHWEMAASPTRQLFEMVLNMEHLASLPSREDGALQFTKYGLLQNVRSQLQNHDYERLSGRPVDEERIAGLQKMINSPSFDEFKGKPRPDGAVNWVTSWNRKNARDMAMNSPEDIRIHQYASLFAKWSEETHATPGALMDAMFRQAEMGWMEKVVADDDKETVELITMALSLFWELNMLLPHAPSVNGERVLAWNSKLRAGVVEHFGYTAEQMSIYPGWTS